MHSNSYNFVPPQQLFYTNNFILGNIGGEIKRSEL